MTKPQFLLGVTVDRYENKMWGHLPATREDFRRLRDTLQASADHSPGQLSLRVLPTLADEAAKKSTMLEALDRLSNLGDEYPGGQLICYWGGHGAWIAGANGHKYYLVPHDGGKSPRSWIPTGEVIKRLRRTGLREIVVLLDVCYSGGAVFETDFRRLTGISDIRELQEGFQSLAVIASTLGRHEAHEHVDPLRGGFFVPNLCRALNGEGVYADEDGWISINNAVSVAQRWVREEAHFESVQQDLVPLTPSAPIHVTRARVPWRPPPPRDSIFRR